MYRINRLNRPVLITVDEVINQCVIDQDADIRYILNSIIPAEERWIRPVLGNEMYRDFVNQKNVVVTDANQGDLLASINASFAAARPVKNAITLADLPVGCMVNSIDLVANQKYKDLWNMYLWKICAECVDVLCIVPSWLRHTAVGQQKNNPVVIGGNTEGSATGDRKDVEFKTDAMIQGRILPMIAAMEQWICEVGGFAKYPECKCCKPQTGIAKSGMGGLILGVYDDC